MTKWNIDAWLPPRAASPTSRPRAVLLGGDGIGPETIDATRRCLEVVAPQLDLRTPPHGREAEATHGSSFPDETRREADEADAVLFGACDTGPEGRARPILRYLRFQRQAWANLRPAQCVAGLDSRLGDNVNLVVVRELTEGLYPGREGELSELVARWPEFRDRLGRELPKEGKFAIRVVTEDATRRIARYAGKLAAHRRERGFSPGIVTIIDKANVLPQTCGGFRRLCEEELDGQGLEIRHMYVDEAARRMVARADEFDVVLTTNLFGDILSDISAESMGGMPVAPSAGIGDDFSYFEPCHGSAPDIAGKGIANPAGAILSGAMMLSHLGFGVESGRLTDALADVLARGIRTPDLGGDATTETVTSAVLERLTR